ncbi:MAG: 3,4-dihydroxy-2-butanone-4-phosphate synthase [Sphingomonadales bacterium]
MSESFLSSIDEIIEDAGKGRMFILVDDEARENEGDLIIPAGMATPDAINFMARFGRGLICLAMTSERVRKLELPLMSQENRSRHKTAFTVSIEAKEGITTGISAADRARTVAAAIDPGKSSQDIVSPGHVFPLVARDGGVLVRAGHTEASVDIARLSGLNPSAVICEVMNDDGSMARMPDLVKFAQLHGLKVATIRDLIAYRRRHDNLVECAVENDLKSAFGGDWTLKTYVNKAEYAEHLVLQKGEINSGKPVLVRVHVLNIFEDMLGEANDRTGQLARSMEIIGEAGSGVIVIIRDVRATRLSEMMHVRNGEIEDPAGGRHLRDYGIGAQILYDLGVREMILLSDTKQNIVGLDAYGLNIIEQRSIRG